MLLFIIIPQFIIIIILILLSFSFSGSETAYTSLDKLTLSRLIREKKLREQDRKFWKKSHSMIPSLLVGNNIVNITATAILTSLSINIASKTPGLSESMAILLSTIIFTITLLIFGEVLPKTFALLYTESFIIRFFGFMKFFYMIFMPITKVLSFFTSFTIKLLPGKISNKESILSSIDDITHIIHIGHKEGFIEKDTRNFLTGIIEFPSKNVSEIMIPRVNMDCIDAETSIFDILILSDETGHTRFPVYEETIDNIIGILNIKYIIKDYINGRHQKKAIDYIMLPYFVPEDKMLGYLFSEMQAGKRQMAIVVDEYGGTSGMVSIEDILEEIVGDIEDEVDKEKNNIIFKDKKIMVKGEASLEEVNEALKLRLNHGDFQTIAGYILNMLDHIPEPNESFNISSYSVIVKKIEDRRIAELEFVKSKHIKDNNNEAKQNI